MRTQTTGIAGSGRLTPLPPWYADFKATWYGGIDERFEEYFRDRPKTSIRFDEIRWGGVRRDGIPPLDHPKMLAAAKAESSADSDVVFGVSVRGEARAYLSGFDRPREGKAASAAGAPGLLVRVARGLSRDATNRR